MKNDEKEKFQLPSPTAARRTEPDKETNLSGSGDKAGHTVGLAQGRKISRKDRLEDVASYFPYRYRN